MDYRTSFATSPASTTFGPLLFAGWLSAEHLPLPDSYTAAKQTRSFARELSTW